MHDRPQVEPGLWKGFGIAALVDLGILVFGLSLYWWLGR
jgi:hypothetical protein